MTATTSGQVTEAQVSLERLVKDLGAGVLTVVSAPRGLDVPVSHAVIQDPRELVAADEGDLLLAVGIGTSDPGLPELLSQAGKAGATAVLVKGHGATPDLEPEAERAGVAVLRVTPEMTWAQLHGLVRTVLASAGHAPAEPGSPPLGDLFALANAVAMMVGGAVTIEDTQSRVLAFSNLDEPIDPPRRQTILGRRVPDEWLSRLHAAGTFKRLWTSTDVVRIEQDELPDGQALATRLAVAVRAGDEILGSIWVAEGSTELRAQAAEALRQAADMAALHLVRHRAGADLERRMRGELLRALLDGSGPLTTIADRLGIDVAAPYLVVAFQLQTDDEAEAVLQRERALELVAMYCDAYRRRAVQVATRHTLYALLPVPADRQLDGIHRLIDEVVARAQTVLTVPLRAGVGSVVDHLREVPRSRREADQVTRILANADDGRVTASIGDVRSQAILLDLREFAETNPQLRTGKLQSLVDDDRERGSVYVETLRAFLDALGDASRAAAAIGVHPNTFRYRLKRLCEISGIDLDDPEERLVIELQLRLL